jgi:hypothetical protein
VFAAGIFSRGTGISLDETGLAPFPLVQVEALLRLIHQEGVVGLSLVQGKEAGGNFGRRRRRRRRDFLAAEWPQGC